MNSWEIIKQNLTKKERPGSTGYLARLNQAGELYCDLRSHLRDKVKADKVFNGDKEVATAIANRRFLESLGRL